MKRGAVSSALVVLALVGIVGVLAAVTLTVRQPTGLVMQNEAIYTTERAVTVGIACKNFQNLVYFLGYNGNYAVYCCTEDMTSANECKFPNNILIPRSY